MVESGTEPPVDKFCDLVMKGGVASGVVYPRAVRTLAKHYRFHSIGGSSAGAIAATVSAAAEYQRRKTNRSDGFESLAHIPSELSKEVSPGRRRLLGLFQPNCSTRRLFRVLTFALNSQTTKKRVLWTLYGVFRSYLPAVGAGSVAFIAGLVFLGSLGWSIVLLIAVSLVVAAAWLYADLRESVANNGFGLCDGMNHNSEHDALTPWLHKKIQTAAGRSIACPPLTFGDLWTVEGGPREPNGTLHNGKMHRSIDLRVYTTNLSHGRPYLFPIDESASPQSEDLFQERLYFNPEEIRHLFPMSIVQFLLDHSLPYEPNADRKGKDPTAAAGRDKHLRELPTGKNLPVLFAARISLSFPLLLSAIPLYAINHDLLRGDRAFYRCWLSDGGISSNFPMHLFDSLIPRWPTFGITLEPEIEDRGLVYLPKRYLSGYGERWFHIKEYAPGISRLGSFVSSIVSTMQNWNDNTLARMPGVRDRVARVRLRKHEGGFNLNMHARTIETIACRGEQAAEELVTQFYYNQQVGPQIGYGWSQHRYVRLAVVLTMLQDRAASINAALLDDVPHARGLKEMITSFKQSSSIQAPCPPGHELPMTDAQIDALEILFVALQTVCDTITNTNVPTGFRSVPPPELRVSPPA